MLFFFMGSLRQIEATLKQMSGSYVPTKKHSSLHIRDKAHVKRDDCHHAPGSLLVNTSERFAGQGMTNNDN